MPPKYRKLADFHRYYYGEKSAPYLTIFIGGNHEASNYLFELFYGGWVAPKIYYLGAANVIKLGDLKIAGMSGIFNFHDYKRPHFERLPYSDGTMRSIYHQREVDVRKLLAYRNQIDIGLSHDWPRGIEWCGKHDRLFAYKPHIAEDAQRGRLGSEAAAKVMDRLRPLHWFSAHLHAKYAAQKTYNTVDDQTVVPSIHSQQEEIQDKRQSRNEGTDHISGTIAATTLSDLATATVPTPATRGSLQRRARPNDAAAIQSWTSFSNTVQQRDQEEADEHQRQLQARQEERERTGQPAAVPYAFEETWKEVKVSNIGGAQERQSAPPTKGHVPKIPQYDGCCSSTPSPAKRRRPSTSEDDDRRALYHPQQTDGSLSPVKATSVKISNPDAIDVNMSDSDEDKDLPPVQSFHSAKFQISEPEPVRSITATTPLMTHDPFYVPPAETFITEIPPPRSPVPILRTVANSVDENTDDNSEAKRNLLKAHSGRSAKSTEGSIHDGSSAHIDDETSEKVNKTELPVRAAEVTARESTGDSAERRHKLDSVLDVSDNVREQLASMSTTFIPEKKIETSAALPFPAQTITNKTTNFLALSKAELGQNFLQLMEIPGKLVDPDTPPKLEYDPEYLAITRVFSPELVIGSSPNDKIPPHRGDTYYRERIIEEEAWVKESIVDKGLLVIPENFEITSTGDHDPANTGIDQSMPREVTNPQTEAFCKMLGINNPFNISEEARDELMAAGAPSDNQSRSGHRGGRGSYRGGGNRGSHRGGRGGRGGRGRGRGRGRGQW